MYARPTHHRGSHARHGRAKGALAVSGGTDVYPAHVGKPLARPLVDLSGVAGLRGISETAEGFRLGAATTWTDIVRAALPPAFDGLKAAAREVGSIQIQNRGTIAGNLCNASPAADGVPPLLSLDASVEVASSARVGGVLPLSAFITGYRRTALAPGEIVTAVLVPRPAPAARSAFVKLGARRYLVISILMAAAVVETDARGPHRARGRRGRRGLAGGAAAAGTRSRPARLRRDGHPTLVAPRHLAGLSPIDDVRATAAYRLEAAISAVGEALDRAAGDRLR